MNISDWAQYAGYFAAALSAYWAKRASSVNAADESGETFTVYVRNSLARVENRIDSIDNRVTKIERKGA